MKPILYPMLAAIACGFAYGQTAFTNPVGYVTINIPAESDTTVTPPLEKPSLLSAASTGIAGDVVSVSGLTADAFINIGSPNPKCYLQVTSGTAAGKRFPIIANNTSSITVDAGDSTLQDEGFLSGDSFKVVPYWTLNTLFPLGAVIGTTDSVLDPTSFILVSNKDGVGTNRASSKFYFYCTGDVENELPAGWYDNDDLFGGDQSDVIIDPDRMYSIRTSNLEPASLVVSGEVPSVQSQVNIVVDSVDFNDNYLTSAFPINMSLDQSGLQDVIQGTSNVLDPTEFVFVFDDEASGQNKAAAKAYFYCSGDVENEFVEGWYDSDDLFAGPVGNQEVLKAGRCFVIRKGVYEQAGTISWTTPLPYSPN